MTETWYEDTVENEDTHRVENEDTLENEDRVENEDTHEVEDGVENEDTLDMEEYYDDFAVTGGMKGGGGGGKRKNKKDKSKGAGENIYNSKHIRLAEQKKENGKQKNFGKEAKHKKTK